MSSTLAPPTLTIQSIGPPPERYADRIVAEMLRQLAVQKAGRLPTIAAALHSSHDGGPRAQRRMRERVERAGAIGTHLNPGKRGKYELLFYDLVGWDVSRDEEITTDKIIPDKPWLACFANLLTSVGRGREERDFKVVPILFVTHHALSRVAQRFGATNSQHLLKCTLLIFEQVLEELKRAKAADDLYRWLDAIPPEGFRMPLTDDAIVVLKRHAKYKIALVAATIFRNDDDTNQKDL